MKHIPKENIKVNLSVGFLASLQDRHNERYSKHEAFCYLLDKACERYLPKSVKNEVADLMGDFQFNDQDTACRGLALASCHCSSIPRKVNGTWADKLQRVRYKVHHHHDVWHGGWKCTHCTGLLVGVNHPFYNRQLAQWQFHH